MAQPFTLRRTTGGSALRAGDTLRLFILLCLIDTEGIARQLVRPSIGMARRIGKVN